MSRTRGVLKENRSQRFLSLAILHCTDPVSRTSRIRGGGGVGSSKDFRVQKKRKRKRKGFACRYNNNIKAFFRRNNRYKCPATRTETRTRHPPQRERERSTTSGRVHLVSRALGTRLRLSSCSRTATPLRIAPLTRMSSLVSPLLFLSFFLLRLIPPYCPEPTAPKTRASILSPRPPTIHAPPNSFSYVFYR